jgi:hypothetical protein
VGGSVGSSPSTTIAIVSIITCASA